MAQLIMTEDLAKEIIETAFEAGHHGIADWAMVENYQPKFAEMTVLEMDNDFETVLSTTKLNRARLNRAIGRLFDPSTKIAEHYRGELIALIITQNEACRLDGPAADALVQLACLGELRYG